MPNLEVLVKLEAGVRKALYRMMGIVPIQTERGMTLDSLFNSLYEQLNEREDFGYINDLYFEDNGTVSAIISSGGKLYRCSLDSEGKMGEWEEVQVIYKPRSNFNVIRQDDGTYRWFAITETAVLLRVGEIDSRELFDDFIANVAENGYPTLRFFHDDRLDFGKTDWLAREENCLLASGTFDEHPLAEAFIASCERGDEWGNSNGFLPTEDPEAWEVAEGVTVPVFKRGILREISVLPENRAASWFTSITSEVTRMRKEVSDAIIKLFGDEEKARGFIETVDQTNREITEESLVTREEAVSEPTTEESLDVEGTTEEVQIGEGALAEMEARIRESLPDIEAAIEPIRTSIAEIASMLDNRIAEFETRLAAAVAPIQENVADIGTRLAALELPEDEKRREWLDDQPSRQPAPVYRPRQERQADNKSSADIAAATLAIFGED